MAPVVQAVAAHPELRSVCCVTGQHRGMLDQVLRAFGLTPDHDLNIMKAGQDLYDVTARVLLGLRTVIAEEQPDAILVHGDTTSCLAATLAGFYAQVPVGHVEAGLRTGDLASPFPEEANRVLADQLCHWHFAPTERAAEMLLKEGHASSRIHVTGNTVIDALLWMADRVREDDQATWPAHFGSAASVLGSSAPILLVTGHRRESFGGGFERICRALKQLASTLPDVHIVYPVHLNPNVQQPVHAHLSNLNNVHLIEPLAYPDFVRLMDRSAVILTDSGGIQEEAPSLGKPVLVMRDTTERPEGVLAGTVKLVGTDVAKIVDEATKLLTNPMAYAQVQRAHNPYGDGSAATQIAAHLARALGASTP